MCGSMVDSLGQPCKFQQVSRLVSVTARHSSRGRQPNFAALNRGRHLYSAGRPSRWSFAHILVLSSVFLFFSSPNLSRRRLDVYHTSAHGVVLVMVALCNRADHYIFIMFLLLLLSFFLFLFLA